MAFKDEVAKTPIGVFNIKTYDKDDNLLDEYEDNNLVVFSGRTAMAALLASYSTGGNNPPINRFVLGTRGHKGNDILDHIKPGETEAGVGTFDIQRTALFSETNGNRNYHVLFNPDGDRHVTDNDADGKMYIGTTHDRDDVAKNMVQRSVIGSKDHEVQYVVTIPIDNANIFGSPIAYTEAALYAGDRLFAMKTFPARVKEDTVKFVITWSIIF